MKREGVMKKIISIQVLLVLMSFVILKAQTLPKVTVAKFKNSTEFQMQTTDSVTDTFITLLMESKKFDVMERERLKDLNEESVISGKTKIEGCEYIFLNKIFGSRNDRLVKLWKNLHIKLIIIIIYRCSRIYQCIKNCICKYRRIKIKIYIF